MSELDRGQKHILKLIERDAGDDGWASVSEQLYPFLSELMPTELMEFEKTNAGGRARLTDEGINLMSAMIWL